MSTARPLIAVLSLALLAGCAERSPEEKVEAVRANTNVELLSFAVSETPIEIAVDPAGEDQSESPAEAEAEAEPAEVEVRTDVILDLLVSTTATEPLPGITVEYEHVDSAERLKDSRRLWIDTPNLVRGAGAQMSVMIEDVDYVEGDGFGVSVRTPVPEAERSAYREFRGAGER